ncbi:S8 family serine peptidase [Winogradskyella pulchriflava]|uniref:S8 family serine peptidase n=1 Tax=Winogradskyella pulchriflava TaxID=1110688 RepID=A0ABV6Q672_9FLAO
MRKSLQYCILLIAFFVSSNIVSSQELSSNASEANKELFNELKQQENERLERVNTFLLNNPNIKKSLSDGNHIEYIYDVIDGKPIYRSTYNLSAGRATKINHLQVGGSLGLNLDGSGVTVGVWDGGPAQASHPEFANSTDTGSRVTIIDNAIVDGDSGSFSFHATHVSGTIGAKGVSASALGMAPNVNIKSYNWSNDETEMISAVNAATDPIIISNHSYGVPIVNNNGDYLDAWWMGAYTQDARDIDNIARNNPKYLIVASAGNSGTTSYSGGLYAGYDKLTTDKNAKNSLVIANANPTVSEQPIFSGNYEITNLVINSGSSQGPTDDLRIKPDLAADGTNLTSSIPTDAYATYSGTSMSAPNTSGSLVLLQQYYHQLHGVYMNSSTLKGLVCHTAIDDINVVGPDPKFGWGFLNAKASAETILEDQNSQSVIDELTLDEGGTYTFTFSAQAGEKLKATICWTDMPGNIATNGVANDQTPRLVNDLDLRLEKDGTTFFPWKLDYSASTGFSNSKADNSVDNIEVIEIDAPTAGSYTLTVTHKGTLQGNVGGPFDPQSQDFSLIITGSNLTLGVDDNNLLENLSVYPNPSNGEFTISFQSNLNSVDNNVKVEVYDLRGRKVYNNSFINSSSVFKETISLNGIKSGVYLVNISEGNKSTSHKLIIE